MTTINDIQTPVASGEEAERRPAPDTADTSDAIAFLERDHREVEGLFERYEVAADEVEKAELAAQICLALKIHAQIEEELFYPAAREGTGDIDLVDEAVVDHMGVTSLIKQIEAMAPGQPLYDVKIRVLSGEVFNHVEKEESELFPEARESRMDLGALVGALAARKAELLDLMTAEPKPCAK